MKTNIGILILAFLPIFSFAQNKAVSIYDRGSVFVAPDRNSTPVGLIRFGVDVVDMTLETIQQEKTTFVKVKLADGTKGWVSKYLLVPNGEGAVIAHNTPIYQNPVDNETMVRNKEFVAGEPIVFTEFSGPYVYVIGREKSKEGWVSADNLIMGNDEVRAGTMYMAALREPKVEKRLKLLKNLKGTSSNLKIAPLIDGAFNEVASASERGYEDMADVPVKSVEQPIIVADNTSLERASATRGANKVTETNNNAEVIAATSIPAPVSKTAVTARLAATRSIDANARVSSETQTQKIAQLPVLIMKEESNPTPFTCYHGSLPIGSKIKVKIPNNAGFMEYEVTGRLKNFDGIGLTEKSLKRLVGEDISKVEMIEYYPK